MDDDNFNELMEPKVEIWLDEEPAFADENERCSDDDTTLNENSDVVSENLETDYLSKEDESDVAAVIAMFGNEEIGVENQPCCTNACNRKIPKELAVQQRRSYQELGKNEKDLIILSHLQQHRRLTKLSKVYAELQTGKRIRTKEKDSFSRQNMQYYFCDLVICRKMFLFLHSVGVKQFENLVKHFDEQGLTPRTHKHKNVKPKRNNVRTEADDEIVATFIKKYANEMVELPPGTSKRQVYEAYCEAGLKPLARSTFLNIWGKRCPDIVITKPG